MRGCSTPAIAEFPISRDPPEGGTVFITCVRECRLLEVLFPISRDPPEGGTICTLEDKLPAFSPFPISRDPPEGGTHHNSIPVYPQPTDKFPISRDPPEGGTPWGVLSRMLPTCFQFLGIPPKGERYISEVGTLDKWSVSNF